MAKYNAKLLQIAEEWITENGLMTFGGKELYVYCNAMGFNSRSHYNWLEQHPEYKEMIDRAVSNFRIRSTNKATNALWEAAIGGYKENEVTDIQYKPDPNNPNKPIISGQKTHKEKKWHQPSVAALIFLLTNLDPVSFVNRMRNDVTVKNTAAKSLSMEEAQAFLKKLEAEF